MTMKGTSHPRMADLNDNHEDSSVGGRARNSHVPTGRRGGVTEVEEPDPGRKGRKEDDV